MKTETTWLISFLINPPTKGPGNGPDQALSWLALAMAGMTYGFALDNGNDKGYSAGTENGCAYFHCMKPR